MVYHLFEPLTSVFTILLLVLNRKFEFEADMFACQNGYGEELKNSLIRLSEGSIDMVKPDWLYAWLKHSHPTVH
jgi:STE24 endopeptidase